MAEKAGHNALPLFQVRVLKTLRNESVVASMVAAEMMFEAQATIEDKIEGKRPATRKDILLNQNPALGKTKAIQALRAGIVAPTMQVPEIWNDRSIKAPEFDEASL